MAAAAAASPAPADAGGDKKKRKGLTLVLMVVGALVLMAGAAGATLFFSGYFAKQAAAQVEAELNGGTGHAAAGAHGEAGASGAAGKPPQKVKRTSPEVTRFEQSYLQMEGDLVANVAGTKKIMSVNVALMTDYDERVFQNVKKHELALKAIILDVLRKVTEPEMQSPTFREDLAERVREEMNKLLTKHEDFGGLEAVYFTGFIVQ
jgi:flagellar protein FliL